MSRAAFGYYLVILNYCQAIANAIKASDEASFGTTIAIVAALTTMPSKNLVKDLNCLHQPWPANWLAIEHLTVQDDRATQVGVHS